MSHIGVKQLFMCSGRVIERGGVRKLRIRAIVKSAIEKFVYKVMELSHRFGVGQILNPIRRTALMFGIDKSYCRWE